MGWEESLEKKMAADSSFLAWKIPWTEEPGGLQSMGPQSRAQLSMHAGKLRRNVSRFLWLSVQGE